MSMLNFKHGLYGSLFNTDGSNKIGIANGTIYVTTDEKAMYIDLNNQRIRLSQIVNIPTTEEWQQLKPPFSKEAFYYILDANALLKFNGTDWVQINSTAEIEGILTAMGFHSSKPTSPKKGDIYTKDDGSNEIYNGSKWVAFTNLGSNVIDLDSRLTTLESTVSDLSEALSQEADDRKDADDALASLIADLSGVINYIGKGKLADRPATPALGSVYIAVDEQDPTKGTIWVYKSKSATEGEWSSDAAAIGAQIDTLRLRIEAVAAIAGDTTAFDNLQQTLSDLSEDLQNAKDAIQDIEDGITNAKYIKADGTVAMEADLNVASHKVINVADPTAATDAANKKYVDAAKEAVLGKDSDGKVSTETVQSAYEKAAATAEQLRTLSEDVKDLTDDAKELKTFGAVETALSNINQTINKLNDTYATDEELKTAKEAILGKDSKGQVSSHTVQEVYDKAADNAQDIKNIQEAYATMTEEATITTFAGIEGELGKINTTISKLDDTYATDDELKTAKEAILGKNSDGKVSNETVQSVYDKAAQNESDINDLSDEIDELRDDLLGKIQTADAMVYRGTVNASSALPTTAEIGDTYKAINEFTLNGTAVKIGDLLIAKGTEDPSTGKITEATLAWDHIPSGYVADYNPELEISANSTNNVATVNLTSAHADAQSSGDLGAFSIAGAANSSIGVSVDNNTVVIGMTWGTF